MIPPKKKKQLVDVNSLIDDSQSENLVDVSSLIDTSSEKKNGGGNGLNGSDVSSPIESVSPSTVSGGSAQTGQVFPTKENPTPYVDMQQAAVPEKNITPSISNNFGMPSATDLAKQNSALKDNTQTLSVPILKQKNVLGEDSGEISDGQDEGVQLAKDYQNNKKFLDTQHNILNSQILNTYQDKAVAKGDMPSPKLIIPIPIKEENPVIENLEKDKNAVIEKANDLRKETIKKAGVYANKINANATTAGLTTRAILGEKSAIQQSEFLDKGLPVAPSDLFYNDRQGLEALNDGIDEQYKDDLDNPEYKAKKADIQNQYSTLIDKYPEFKRQQISKIVAQEIMKEHPNADGMMLLPYGMQAAKKLGLSDEDIKSIDFDNLPIQSPISSAAGAIYNGIIGLGAGAARILGTAAGIDKDFLTANLNEATRDAAARFEDVSAINAAHSIVDADKKSPTYLQDVANPEAGKYNYNFHTISNAIGHGIGALAQFIGGTKVVGGIVKSALPVVDATEAGMAGLMIGQGYEPYYQKAIETISDKPEDEWKRHAYALLNGSLDYLGFRTLGKVVKEVAPDAKTEIANVFKESSSLAKINRNALTKATDKIIEGIKQTVGETAFVGSATAGSEIAKNIVDNVIGTPEAAKKSNAELGNVLLTGVESLPFAIMIPVGLSKVISGVRGSMVYKENIYNAGLNPETYLGQANKLLHDGIITQDQYNQRAQVVNTAAKVVNSIPTDIELNHNQRVAYTNSKVRELALKAQKENVDDAALEKFYDDQIKQEVAARTEILNGGSKESPYVAPEADTKLSQPIEGLDEQGIPIGENVPAPETNAKNEAETGTFEDKVRILYPALKNTDNAGVNDFIKENATDSPSKFIKEFGEDKFNEVVSDITIPELKSKLKIVKQYTPDSEDVSILDKAISAKEDEAIYGKKGEPRIKLDFAEGKPIIEPPKPISEMNSEEIGDYATEVRHALKQHEKEFANKTEKEKEDGGYYDYIDNVAELRDTEQRVNFVENSENLNDLANSTKAALRDFNKDNPSQESLAILNAAKKKAAEMNIAPETLIKEVIKKVGNDYKDKNDAELMMQDYLEKIVPEKPTTQEQGVGNSIVDNPALKDVESTAKALYKSYKEQNPHSGGGLSGNAKAFDELPNDSEVFVYTATTPKNAEAILSGKEVTPELQGQGIKGESNKIYVASDPRVVSGLGKTIIGFKVKKSDLALSPEAVKANQTLGKSIVTSATGAILEGKPMVSFLSETQDRMNTSAKSGNEALAEAYHKAKADGSNPELVKAVEDLINKNEPNTRTTSPTDKVIQPEIAAPKGQEDKGSVQSSTESTGRPNAEAKTTVPLKSKLAAFKKKYADIVVENPASENANPNESKDVKFSVKEQESEAVSDMKDIVNDYMDNGTTKLKDIQDEVAKELENDTPALKSLVEDAFNAAGKELKIADTDAKGRPIKNELTISFAKRINSFVDKIFGKSNTPEGHTVILKDGKAVTDAANNVSAARFMKDGSPLKLYHSTTNPISGEFRVKGKNNSYGIFFSPKKSYSKVFGDITYKVEIEPKNTKVFNDNEVGKSPFFNIKENELNKYLEDGYDSLSWYRNGKMQEFVVLDSRIIKDREVVFMKNEKGEVLGFTDPATGKIYLNGEKLNPNTPIHEAGHLWVNWAKENDTPLHKRGLELTENSKYLKKVKGNKFYQDEASKLPKAEQENYYREEALASAIGDKGAQFVSESRKKSFAEWAKQLWDNVAKAVGFKDVSAKEIQGMTLDEFSKRAATDILKGEPQKSESGKGNKPPTNEVKVAEGEDNTIGIRHIDTAEIRKEFSLPEYQREVETIEQWNAKADERIKNGEMKSVIDKFKEGELPSSVEQVMMGKYIAELDNKAAETMNDKDIKALRDAVILSDKIGGGEWGASGRARQIKFIQDDSLGSFLLAKMEANAVDTLTDKQKAQVKKQHEDYHKANEKWEAEKKRLEDKVSRLEAEKELRKISKPKSTPNKTHEDYVAERQKLRDRLKQQIEDYKAAGKKLGAVSDGNVESFIITAKMAKTIGEIVKSHVFEVGNKLSEVTKRTLDDVKDIFEGITEKDIHDVIAGKYNEPQKTRSEKMKDLVDLKTQARLINKLSDLENGVQPTTEKKRVERNQEITELRRKIADFTKENPDNAKLLAALKKRVANDIKKVQDDIDNKRYAPPKKEPTKIVLDQEAKDALDELIRLKNERHLGLLREQYQATKGTPMYYLKAVSNVLNVPRSLMSSGDFSAILRQAVIPTISHPVMAARAAKAMFEAATSQKNYDRWFYEFQQSPRYKLIEQSKLGIADSTSPLLTVREEAFMSNLAEKIPIIGSTVIKGSERAYTMFLNKMRIDLFNRFADSMEARGLTFENSPEQYKQMAAYVNNSTGRGDLGNSLNKIAPLLNSLFFSPRLIASRLNMLTYFAQPRFYTKVPKEVRRAYFLDMGKFATLGLTVLALATLNKDNKTTVESNPTSSDFGKIKNGVTRWDIWGGFQQYIRVAAQFGFGEKTSNGKTTPLGEKSRFGETRLTPIGDALRNKLAPIPGMAVDMFSGRTSIGDKIVYESGIGKKTKYKEIPIDQYILEHLLPLTATGMYDAYKDQGVKSLGTVLIPSIFGVGVQTYDSKKKKHTGASSSYY